MSWSRQAFGDAVADRRCRGRQRPVGRRTGSSAALASGPPDAAPGRACSRITSSSTGLSSSTRPRKVPNGSANPTTSLSWRAIFLAFQNGSAPGRSELDRQRREYRRRAQVEWSTRRSMGFVGKCDGLTADPSTGRVIATVNEDAHSSLYTIDPTRGTIAHYHYSEPLPSFGGTDAISIYRGMVLISASAPGTAGLPAPQPSYPAVYQVRLNPGLGRRNTPALQRRGDRHAGQRRRRYRDQ